MQSCRLLQRCSHNPHLLLDRGQSIAVFSKLIDVLLNVDGSYLANRHRSDLEAFQRLCRGQETIVGTFVALVDRVVVRQDRTLEFIFRNGMKYEYIIVV